jgi:hypothetical protein
MVIAGNQDPSTDLQIDVYAVDPSAISSLSSSTVSC